MAAGHFAGHFSAVFGFGPVSHSVAGQPSRNFRAQRGLYFVRCAGNHNIIMMLLVAHAVGCLFKLYPDLTKPTSFLGKNAKRGPP